jgi:hypothetical protein
MMFGALWIWQRWIAVLRPKLRRIAHASAFEPSMMNKRGTAGSKTGPLDVTKQEEADEEQKRKDQRAANHTRLRPSSVEIAHMEQAICWPARYLHSLPQLLRTVQAVAAGRARDRDMEHAARRLRLPGRVVRRWNGEALALIAKGLNKERIQIW